MTLPAGRRASTLSRMRRPPVSATMLVALAVFGCADPSKDRPPRIGDCLDCGTGSITPPVGGGGGVDGGGGGVDGGGGLDAGTLTMSGRVLVYDTELFTPGPSFVGDGTVGAEGATGRVTADFSNDSYSLDGVFSATGIWADLEPTMSPNDVMQTILWVDPRDEPVDLSFARRGVLENIGSGLVTPQVLDPGSGHAFLRFVDDAGDGIAGITVTDQPGGVVTYDVGGGVFRDNEDATSARGAVLILDVSSLPFPGTVTTVTYSGQASGVVKVKFAADTVTVVTIQP